MASPRHNRDATTRFQHENMMSEERAKKFHSDDMSLDQVDPLH